MRVLLVEDDRMIGEAIESALQDAEYAVDWIRDGGLVKAALEEATHALVLLDMGLPGKDGIDVLRSIRALGNQIPILVITARDAVQDRIQGLDAGADDYVLKPFEMTELLARMRAVLRRKGNLGIAALSNGMITLDPTTHDVSIAGEKVRLSSREFSLLYTLMLRPGAILSRSQLEERIYGWNEEVESNAVEFLIHALRKKMGAGSIKNVRGVGWMVARKQ